jgi:hypothetical protein
MLSPNCYVVITPMMYVVSLLDALDVVVMCMLLLYHKLLECVCIIYMHDL